MDNTTENVLSLTRVQPTELVYVGKKKFKEDNVCNTGTVWHGYGDVQLVDKRFLPKFLQHPDVWCLKEDFEKMPVRGVDGGTGQKYTTTHNEDGTITLTPVVSEAVESGSQENKSQDTGNQEPENDEINSEIESKIVSAILSLEQGNDHHFSKSNGVPILSAVRNAASDESITGEQVKAAWTKLKAN